LGASDALDRLNDELREIRLKPVEELTDSRVAWTWQTDAGLDGGTLLVGHLDVPLEPELMTQMYRREPEWLHGEGIGSSRAPLVSLIFALRALRHVRRLQQIPIGVLYYADEGRDCRYSGDIVHQAAARARNVLVLRPGNVGNHIVTVRRGQRRFRVAFDGESQRLGKTSRKPQVLPWVFDRLQQCTNQTLTVQARS
jgi:D-alanine-D-alanine ligase